MVASDPCIGRTIGGKFVIESLIGTGAMGSVYLARHSSLDARVAVKVMHEEMAKDQTFAERFLREARAASRLDHPNVIRVRDYGTEPDGLHYLVMEYVDGVDLGQLVTREFPMSDARIVDVLSQVLSATAAAHAVGIVHRDLKPENVMVSPRFDDDGRKHEVVKVCDFGIAQTSEIPRMGPESPRALTLSGVLLGTPQYMSPEQCRGEQLDARSDLYSVGVMLYELLAGKAPFLAENFIDIVVKHVSEDPVPPSVSNPNVLPALEQVCMRALRKRREERFATAREMRAALRAAIGATDDPSAPLIALEFRAPFPGLDTQPAFSARVPSSRGHRGDVPTLQLETRVVSRKSASSGAFRYVLGATLVGLALLAIVVGRDESSPTEHHRAAGVAVVQPAVEALPAPAPAPPPPAEEPTTVVDGTKAAPAPAKARSKPSARAGHDDTVVLADLADPGVAGSVFVKPPSPPGTEVASAGAPPPQAPADVTAVKAVQPSVPAPSVAVPAKLAPPPLDPSKGSVTWKVSAVGGGATAGGVARALARAASSWSDCYRAGLRARSVRVEGSGTMRIACDDQGRVIEARMSGFGMPDVARCMEQRATGAIIPNADTGEAWSTISLAFKLNE